MSLPPLVDEAALQRYLAERLPGADGALTAERVIAGHSNETFFITWGSQSWVLRRPPLGPLLPTAHDVLREYRVLAALAKTPVPVPQPVLACEDTSVIGAPFYLMERKRGVVIREMLPAFVDTPTARRDLGLALVDVLATLHSVDWRAAGLEGFGKPEGYLERQVRRWMGQLDGARNREIPELDQVSEWLKAHLPGSPPATIVHGDYRMDNVMFADGLPTQVIAILDWEMSTLGDPLADLGYLLSFWRQADDPEPGYVSPSGRISEAEGFPTRQELAERYAEQTGRRIKDVAFYQALAIWKLAVLLEGSYKRHLAGTTDDPFFATLREGVPALARRALAVCQGHALN
ncbi:MAG TPA: phosphotransferase family protein [Ktedonobacterales bacterium]|jgi:aminoglycoside phosphotransferase (APT) family kinase protein